MIYFVQSVDGGPVKIGYSADVSRRVGELEATYRRPLSLLGTMKGDRRTEREIHARFSHLRFGRTEQFRPAADLMEFIDRPLLVGANPDAVEAIPTLRPSTPRLSVQASPQWIAWVEEGADHCRTDISKLVDAALADYLKARGFEKKPPRRVP